MLVAVAIALCAALEVQCPGEYGGHLQGVATDGERNIYWSFTVALVKTDAAGAMLKSVEVPTHHGGLVWVEGLVYVAVNLGKFNLEAGKADSWVYVYDAESLELKAKHAVPEAVHGAGGIAFCKDRFLVVGGLPPGHDRNYVYRYDRAFTFVDRREILSGYTLMGLQSALCLDGLLWFGPYGAVREALRTDEEFGGLQRYGLAASYGRAPWGEGQWVRGLSLKGGAPGMHRGAVVVEVVPVGAR